MSSEFLEKIRNVIVTLLVLFISILNTWIAFCSLPVHAAESTPSDLYTFKWGTDYYCENFYDREYSFSITVPYKNVFAACNNYDSDNKAYVLAYYDSEAQKIVQFTDYKKYTSWEYICVDNLGGTYSGAYSNDVTHYSIGFNEGYQNYAGHQVLATWHAEFPVFKSRNDALNFYENSDTSGLINGGSIDNPDFEDTAYAFTGFSANNKMTATWTGTTERSYLKDQDVEEYVRVNYYFADKEAPDTIKQADAYPDEFATADKTLTIDVSGLKPDDENWFLRYIRITPCYRQAGLGAWGDFYHGSDVYVYFDVKGNIEKVIQKSKPTDLNKGNMVYDSSIGYLQNVIYTEQKTHDGSGRQATFKWSTLKSLPDDAQIEIVAQNFYIEWFNKKTEENFIYKEYGEDCFYSAGSYSFNANTPVWTWLKEKEIDPFSIKTQSYGSTEYYLRIVVYNDSDSLYHYGGWVKVNIKSKDTTIMPSTDVETGGFEDSSGLWNQDTASSDSYHYSTDDKGKLTGNIDVNSWEDLNMNSFTWMYRNMQSMVSSLGEFPAMLNAVFGYLPVQYITSIGVLLVAIVLLRFLGR